MSNPSAHRFADVIIRDKEIWNLGECGDVWSLNGKGTMFYPKTNEMFIGEFVDGKPAGHGIWLGRSTRPLEGNWSSNWITSITWSNIEYEEPSIVSRLWSMISGKVSRGDSNIA